MPDKSDELLFLEEGKMLLEQALEYAGPGVSEKINLALDAQKTSIYLYNEEVEDKTND